MFNNLQNLGWGLVGFALIVGMGSVMLHNFGGAVADCKIVYGNTTVYNTTTDTCQFLNDGVTQNGSGVNPPSAGWTNTNYLLTQLGSSGLAGWTPAIIAISVGMLIFGAFLIGGGAGGRRY